MTGFVLLLNDFYFSINIFSFRNDNTDGLKSHSFQFSLLYLFFSFMNSAMAIYMLIKFNSHLHYTGISYCDSLRKKNDACISKHWKMSAIFLTRFRLYLIEHAKKKTIFLWIIYVFGSWFKIMWFYKNHFVLFTKKYFPIFYSI